MRAFSESKMMAKGLAWPAPMRQQASTAGCAISLLSMGAGATYLPFAGLELLLDASDDLHLAVGFEKDDVAGTKEAILA